MFYRVLKIWLILHSGNEEDIHEESGYGLNLDFANHLVLLTHFVSLERWFSWEKWPFKTHLPYGAQFGTKINLVVIWFWEEYCETYVEADDVL